MTLEENGWSAAVTPVDLSDNVSEMQRLGGLLNGFLSEFGKAHAEEFRARMQTVDSSLAQQYSRRLDAFPDWRVNINQRGLLDSSLQKLLGEDQKFEAAYSLRYNALAGCKHALVLLATYAYVLDSDREIDISIVRGDTQPETLLKSRESTDVYSHWGDVTEMPNPEELAQAWIPALEIGTPDGPEQQSQFFADIRVVIGTSERVRDVLLPNLRHFATSVRENLSGLSEEGLERTMLAQALPLLDDTIRELSLVVGATHIAAAERLTEVSMGLVSVPTDALSRGQRDELRQSAMPLAHALVEVTTGDLRRTVNDYFALVDTWANRIRAVPVVDDVSGPDFFIDDL